MSTLSDILSNIEKTEKLPVGTVTIQVIVTLRAKTDNDLFDVVEAAKKTAEETRKVVEVIYGENSFFVKQYFFNTENPSGKQVQI